MIAEAAKSISAEGAQLGGMVQQIVGNLNSSLAKGEEVLKGRGVEGAQGALAAFQKDVSRLAYINALQTAMKKAASGGPFNLETAMNDLWIAMDGLKKGMKKADTKAGQQQEAQVLERMNSILKTMHEASMSAIRNLR